MTDSSTKPRPEQIAATVRDLDRLGVDPGTTIVETTKLLRASGVQAGTVRVRLAIRARRDREGLSGPTPRAGRGALGARPAQAVVRLDSLVDERLIGALCRGRFPLFDAEVHGETATQRAQRLTAAAGFCSRCPVRAACEGAASELGSSARGVWGGRPRGGL